MLRDEEVVPKHLMVPPILSEITSIPQNDPALWVCLPCVGAPGLALLLVGQNAPSGDVMFKRSQKEMVEHLYNFALGGLEAVGKTYRDKKYKSNKVRV